MDAEHQYVLHPHSQDVIRHADYIAGLAKGLHILEAFGVAPKRNPSG